MDWDTLDRWARVAWIAFLWACVALILSLAWHFVA
jgi:hypothetical protein